MKRLSRGDAYVYDINIRPELTEADCGSWRAIVVRTDKWGDYETKMHVVDQMVASMQVDISAATGD